MWNKFVIENIYLNWMQDRIKTIVSHPVNKGGEGRVFRYKDFIAFETAFPIAAEIVDC